MRTRKFRQWISFFLICVLLLQLLTPGNLWPAASAASMPPYTNISGSTDIVRSSSNTVVPLEIPDTFAYQDSEDSFLNAYLPELTDDEIRYVNVLSSETQFSTLAELDTEFLCDYTKIPAESFSLLESNGIALSRSIAYAELAALFDLPLTTIISEAPTDEEYQTLLSQITLYKELLLPSMAGSDLDETLKLYIFNGYSCEQVFNAYGVSQALDIDFGSLLSGGNDLSGYDILSETEIAEITAFSGEFSVSSHAVAHHIVNNDITITEVAAAPSAVQAAISEITITGTFSATETESENFSPVFPELISAPVSYNYSEHEKYSLSTGSLTYETTDFVLPGINGLDLVIGRRYDSQKASSMIPSIELVEYSSYTFFVLVTVQVYFESPSGEKEHLEALDATEYCGPYSYSEGIRWVHYYNGREHVYYDDTGSIKLIEQYSAKLLRVDAGIERYVTAIGVSNRHFDDLYGLGYGWQFTFSSIEKTKCGEIIHLSSGESYYLDWDINNKAQLKGHDLDDIVVERELFDFSFRPTFAYYRLTYQNGTSEYFSQEGKLLGIRDRYGNAIKFEHSSNLGFPYIKITDTLNRITTISAHSDTSGQAVTVTLPDNTELVYKVEQGDSDDILALSSFTDAAGNMTHYNYAVQSALFDVAEDYKSLGQHDYLNLTTITYPTGAQTAFTYETGNRSLGNTGHMEVYKLVGRTDLVESTAYNGISIAYSSNDCSGYPEFCDPGNIPDTFTYSTTVTAPQGTTTSSVFNKDHLMTTVTIRNGEHLLRETLYEYNEDELPVKTTVRQYNLSGKYLEAIEAAEYDNKGNVTAQWSTLANGDTTNTEHKTTYTYDSTYGLPLTQTYKTNESTTVRVENALSADKKSIVSTAVYTNDILTRKTDYVYDSFGNVTQQKQYRDMGDLTDYALTECTYQNGAYLTQEKHSGLVAADGTAAAATPGQAVGIVVTTHTYDTLGRRLTTTDGNGNATAYTYDALGNVTSVTNPDGTTVTYDRNYIANQLTVTDENGNSIIYTYTPLGQEYEIVDGQTNGVITRKEYDAYSRLSRVTDFVYGSVTHYSYDMFDRVLSETVYQGETVLAQTLYTYDDAAENGLYQKVTKTIVGDSNAPSIVTTQYTDKHGNVVKTGKALNGTEYFDVSTFDYVGNVLSTLTAADAEKELEYSTRFVYNEANQVVTTYNALGQFTTNTYDALGNLVQATDYVGTPTAYTYDNLGRLLSQTFTIEEGVTASTKYEYDPAGNLIREYKPTNAVGSTATWAKTDYTYDSRGHLTAVIQYEGDAVASVTRYTYDGAGNTLTMTTGLESLEDTEGSTTTYTYDRFGNVLTTTDALGKTETNSYSSLGRLNSSTDRNGSVTNYTYDALGRLLTTTVGEEAIQYTYTLTGQLRQEQQGQQLTQYTYDALGRTVQTVESPFSYTKTYTYDLADNRTSMTVVQGDNTVQAVTYTHDDLNRLSTVTENGILRAAYTYDDNGNRASLTYGNGVVENYQYNLANWITSLVNCKGNETLSSYAYTYYASGSQKSETDHNDVVTSYTYDDLGRLIEESETGGQTITYTYDANGNRLSLTASGTPVVDEDPDPVPEPDPEPTPTPTPEPDPEPTPDPVPEPTPEPDPTVIVITLDPNGGTLPDGAPSQITLPVPEGYSLPVPTRKSYTFVGWCQGLTPITNEDLAQITESCTLTARWRINGDFGGGGEIVLPIVPKPPSVDRSIPSGAGSSYTTTYTYDANNRLISEVSDKTGADVLIYYTYDDNGNLLSQLDVNSTAIVTHAYDGFNQLVTSVTGEGTITYTYNAQGIRTSRTVGLVTTHYLLDGGNVIGEVTGDETYTYVRGVNLIFGRARYYLYNAHGDVVQLTNTNGQLTKNYNYDAFGNERSPYEADTNPFRYCGEYYDTETSLYYLRARYYDPLIGRFTQEDTHWNTANMIYGDNPRKINEREDALGLKHYSYAPELLSVLQAGNLYVYCVNSPVAYSDETGELLGWAIGGIVGGLFGAIGAAISGENIWAGALSGAVSGAITGLAADLIAITGGTGLIVVAAFAAAGAGGTFFGELARIGVFGKENDDTLGSLLKDSLMGGLFGALGGLVAGPASSLAREVAKNGRGLCAQLWTMLKQEWRNLPMSFLEEIVNTLASWVFTAGEYIVGVQIDRAFS